MKESNEKKLNCEKTLRILVLEDVPRDADLAIRELRRAGISFEARVVDSKNDMLRELEEFNPDIILSDYSMPQFTGMDALEIRNKHKPDLPFVIVTASINEETAVECIKNGADDYVTKEHLVGLPHAVRGAIEKKRLEQSELRAKKQIKLAAQQWRTSFDAIQDAVAILDMDHRILRCNRRMRDFIDKPWDKIIGSSCFKLIHGLDGPPENCPFVRAICSLSREEWETSVGDNVYNVIADPIIDENGLVTGIVHIIKDITESKQTEKKLLESQMKLNTIYQSMNDGILMAEGEKRVFVDANQTMCRMLGYNLEEIRTLTVEDIHPADEMRRVNNAFEAQMRGEISMARKIPVKRRDGSVFYADINAVPLEITDKNYLLGVFRDMTDRIKEEEKRKELQDQFLQAQKLETVGRLAGGIAHDFNNMLSVIIGHTEFIMSEIDNSDPVYDDFKEILDAANHSAEITGQLLAFARKQVINPVVLDLNETIENMLKMLRRVIGEDISLNWHSGANLWPIKIDHAQLNQVLANLCINSRDAISGVGEIIIETKNKTLDEAYCSGRDGFRPGDYVILTVRDNGIGMEKEIVLKIFEPFFTTKDKSKGTGLGLSTVYGIVKQNNGFVNVYSEPNKGTVFNIYFPRVSYEVQKDIVSHENRIPRGEGEVILVVEDESSVLELAEKILKNLGYTVLAASNPTEAMERATGFKGKIDLLIADMILPEMSGIELAEKIKKNLKDIEVLFMSGYIDDTIVNQNIFDKGAGYLQKPFTRKNLAEKVKESLTS